MYKKRGSMNASGGPNAPRLPNRNINWNEVYRRDIKPFLDNQKAANTVRGILYPLEAKGVLKKSDYKGLDDHLVKWRLDGVIPWEKISDGSGRGIVNDFNDEFKDIESWIDDYIYTLKNGAKYYRERLNTKWRWYGQPKYVEFQSEKHTITGTVIAHTKVHWVKVGHNRGNNGWGNAHDYGDHLIEQLTYTDLDTGEVKPRKMVHVWYLGDSDDWGLKMDRHLRDQLATFEILERPNFQFKRIAVLPEQVEEYAMRMSKSGGSKNYGYEIDALNAYNEPKFQKLLIDHIEPYFDKNIHKRLLKKYPAKIIDKMIDKKIEFLE